MKVTDILIQKLNSNRLNTKRWRSLTVHKKRCLNLKTLKLLESDLKNDVKFMKKILFFTFVSFIPLLSVYLVAAFTMINPRYQKNHSFIVIFLTTILLYLIASSLQKWGTPLALFISIIFVAALGRWLFAKRVAKYF